MPKELKLKGIIDLIFHQISAFHWSRPILRSITPADDDNTWLYLEEHPNQIKRRNRCCSELNTFQRLVSKDIMALFILHVSRPAQPLPLPQTTYEGRYGGWLWNGLTSLACFALEMKWLIFGPLSLSPLLFCSPIFLCLSPSSSSFWHCHFSSV